MVTARTTTIATLLNRRHNHNHNHSNTLSNQRDYHNHNRGRYAYDRYNELVVTFPTS